MSTAQPSLHPPSSTRPPWVALATVAAMLAASVPAGANSTGIVGYSGRSPSLTCNSCHSGGSTPLVRFEGPTDVLAGTTSTYTFVVTSQAAAQNAAGFDIAATAGQLGVSGQTSQLIAGEVTHKSPLKVNASKEASWQFTWTAPGVGGSFTLFGAGNSVNGDKSQLMGDRGATTSIVVNVTGSVTATPTVPTPTRTPPSTRTPTRTATSGLATATPSPSSTPTPSSTPSSTSALFASATPTPTPTIAAPCPGDCDQNRQISPQEVLDVVGALNGLGTATCAAADVNADGKITAGDLTRIVASLAGNASDGCRP